MTQQENLYYVYGYTKSKDSLTTKSKTFYYFGKGKWNRAYVKIQNGDF